jgi:hypothetical protein
LHAAPLKENAEVTRGLSAWMTGTSPAMTLKRVREA